MTEIPHSLIKSIVEETLRQLGKLETQITQAEAYRRYKRSRVEKLKHKLNPIRDTETGAVYYEVATLEIEMKKNQSLEKFRKDETNIKKTNPRKFSGAKTVNR